MCMTADALRIGPLVFSWTVLLALAATWAGIALAGRLARRAGLDLGRMPETAALVGFVAARLAFVWQFAGAYLAQPWTVLDLRDGGWEPVVGFAAAWLYGLSRMTRQPATRSPLRWGLVASTGVWLAGTLALLVAAPTGARLPALALTALDDGATVSLDRFVGQPLVVNLWATWCPPCVREMPVLQQAQRQHPDVRIVLINQGEPAERVRAWLAGRRLDLQHVLLDPRGGATAALDAAGLPTTLFYAADGRLVSRRVGEVSEATLSAELERIKK
jgi:thiol-disulfide isomerase/thioredoxin